LDQESIFIENPNGYVILLFIRVTVILFFNPSTSASSQIMLISIEKGATLF